MRAGFPGAYPWRVTPAGGYNRLFALPSSPQLLAEGHANTQYSFFLLLCPVSYDISMCTEDLCAAGCRNVLPYGLCLFLLCACSICFSASTPESFLVLAYSVWSIKLFHTLFLPLSPALAQPPLLAAGSTAYIKAAAAVLFPLEACTHVSAASWHLHAPPCVFGTARLTYRFLASGYARARI